MNIQQILGDQAEYYLGYQAKLKADTLQLPGPDFIERVFNLSDRSPEVIANLRRLYNHGRLSGSGYLSILPVDQGVEHGAGYSFTKNIDYFDPQKIIELALAGGCSGVASTYGILSLVAKRYAEQIPLIVKLNHNELLSSPNQYDQTLFSSVEQAANLGAVGVGATIYFGSADSRRQISEVSQAFAKAHQLGLVTILWCYLRNTDFKTEEIDGHFSADLTGQANYLGATIGADIIKQKQPLSWGGLAAVRKNNQNYSKYNQEFDQTFKSEHPIDLTRYQVLNGLAGRVGLINSGGGRVENDLQAAVVTAVINKRAGGMGLILGRKAFQKQPEEGVALLQAVQDVYLDSEITIA